MNIKNTFGRAAGIAAAAVGIVGLNLPSVASASTAQPAAAAAESRLPRSGDTCAFQTYKTRNYLTAVGGGGRTTDVLHTDATRIRAWEKFKLIDSGDRSGTRIRYGLRTSNGHYLTAVGGGGRITDVMHSDATQLRAWEKFTLVPAGWGIYAIQTIDGHYLTAVSGGGRITDTIHSDATIVRSWEKFRVKCGRK
ncbi:fascin domain-containing protein [Nonomuraea polychroma]|uniref:fascin domain-containing protein n=1 Tax=Nonomuraea polychroma TaxID=46176 RepID=UPI003D8A28F1